MLLARFHDPLKARSGSAGSTLPPWIRDTIFDGGVRLAEPEAMATGMSIHDNIALGRPGAGRDEVIAAAKAANIDDEIVDLPHGYDTVYGSEVSLSGGQRQHYHHPRPAHGRAGIS